jgi:undecaprenyl-diphosphatase
MYVNPLDNSIIAFLNEPSHRFIFVDKVMKTLVDWHTLKGSILLSVIWGLWFAYTNTQKKRVTRELIVSTLIACFFSLFIAQLLEHILLPFRIRPVFNPDIQFILPSGWDPRHYSGASCFPSDNATLFFTLATGLVFINRSIGATVSLYVLLIICLPRIYLGLHYPTDILAGAFLGVGVSLLFHLKNVRCHVTKPFMRLMDERPGFFYACFFLASFQMGISFLDIRHIADHLSHLFVFPGSKPF